MSVLTFGSRVHRDFISCLLRDVARQPKVDRLSPACGATILNPSPIWVLWPNSSRLNRLSWGRWRPSTLRRIDVGASPTTRAPLAAA